MNEIAGLSYKKQIKGEGVRAKKIKKSGLLFRSLVQWIVLRIDLGSAGVDS